MENHKSATPWFMISIMVEREDADIVANVLREFVPGGVVLERIYGGVFPHELENVRVPVRVYGYLPVNQKLEDRRKEITKALQNLKGIFSLPEPVYTPLEEQDWTTAWQKDYRPISLGSRLIVVPSWLKNPTPDRLPVFMDPGMAFGSGTHPTTQLSLILLEECLAEDNPSTLLDIGCGSGILTIAGAKLGVNTAQGLDTDPDAIRVSRANAEKNQVDDKTSFTLGSVKQIIEKEIPIPQSALVVANIIAPILINLFEDGLKDVVSPGGRLILSGILDEQVPGMLNVLADHGFSLKGKRKQGEWIGLWGKRETN
ncbi:MAG: 50S ribosomal protein L11 methyltransferase [Anaerolineales bacterium]|nr:50S ribosomal protein L11 methyltransferase [Anaerolineales bacterium]